MRIDLHTHTAPASDCSAISHREYVDFCRRAGIRAIALTNHDEIADNQLLAPRLADIGVALLHGVEISTMLGDFLVFSPDLDYLDTLHDVQAPLKPAEVPPHAAIVWAHPAAGGGRSGSAYFSGMGHLVAGAVHAIEVYNGRWQGSRYVEAARALAGELGLPMTGGSDAHRAQDLMTCYTEVAGRVRDTGDLVAALRAGAVQAGRQRKHLFRRRPEETAPPRERERR